MRYKFKYPKRYSMRTIKRFLWLPLQIHNEIRWLEYAQWQQMYLEQWENSNWVNDL